MVGRGFLRNPFLPAEIKNTAVKNDRRITVRRFTEELYYRYRKESNDALQSLNKMKELWSYLSYLFDNHTKVFGTIKKSKTFDQYEDAVKRVFDVYGSKII
jgi:tRNA-dihydrouridine synthase